jgi:hypothetical protein
VGRNSVTPLPVSVGFYSLGPLLRLIIVGLSGWLLYVFLFDSQNYLNCSAADCLLLLVLRQIYSLLSCKPTARMQHTPRDPKDNEANKPNSTGTRKPIRILVPPAPPTALFLSETWRSTPANGILRANLPFQTSHGTTRHHKCPYTELMKDPAFTALVRPWPKIWRDRVHRCDEPILPQNPHGTSTAEGGDQHRPGGIAHPSLTRSTRMPTPPRETSTSYALDRYLNQSVKDEPWKDVFGFYTRRTEDVGEDAG